MASRSEQIQQAAARLFAERGYGATSIDDIGAAAGVSGPAIYWHFPGKQALLAAMLTDVSEQLLAGGRDCVQAAPNAEAALAALVGVQVRFALGQPDLIVVHGRELGQLDEQQAHTVRAATTVRRRVGGGAAPPLPAPGARSCHGCGAGGHRADQLHAAHRQPAATNPGTDAARHGDGRAHAVGSEGAAR